MAHWKPYGKIDAHVQAAAEHLLGKDPYAEVREIVHLARAGLPHKSLDGLGGVFELLKKAAPGWELQKVVLEHMAKRARDYLRHTKTRYFKGEKREVRQFENYKDAEGRYRWQPLRAMTADELELCVLQRRKRMRGEEIRIDVYEALIAQLRQLPAGATVEQVEQQVLAANP